MSYYSSLGVTVHAGIAKGFLEILRTLEYDRPEKVYRTSDGAISAVWQDHNRFYEGNQDYDRVMGYLRSFDGELYCYEYVGEDTAPEIGGMYGLNFSTRTEYIMEGKPVQLYEKPVRSNSLKKIFGRWRR